MRSIITTQRDPGPFDARPTLLAVAESWLCGVLSLLLLFEAMVGLLLLAFDLKTANVHVSRWISVPLLVVVSPINFLLMARIWDTLRVGRHPMPLDIARQYLPLGRAARLFYCITWAVYAALGLSMAYTMMAAVERLYGQGLEIGAVGGIFLLSYATTFLANLFVVLFLAAFTNGLAASVAFWRRRFWVDVVISAILVIVTMLRR